MKKLIIPLALLCLLLAGCSEGEGQTRDLPSTGSTVSQIMEDAAQESEPSSPEEPEAQEIPAEEIKQDLASPVLSETAGIDIDLTIMSSTMVYAEVSGLVFEPEKHIGEVVRMRGESASVFYEPTGQNYYYVIVADATACCAQGIEYQLPEGSEYPPDGQEVTVTGEFETYQEEGFTYCRLKNAVME